MTLAISGASPMSSAASEDTPLGGAVLLGLFLHATVADRPAHEAGESDAHQRSP